MSISAGRLPNYLRSIDPAEFEEFVADLWERRGWATRVTTASNDSGIDIVARKSDIVPQKHLIQVKRYGEDNTVGGPELQQYAGLKTQEQDADAIIVVTTSTFTSSAQQVAEQSNLKCIDVDDLCSLVTETGAEDLVREYSTLDTPETADSSGSTASTTTASSSSSQSASQPSHRDTVFTRLERLVDNDTTTERPDPVIFEEIRRDIPTGPLPDMGRNQQTEYKKQFSLNALQGDLSVQLSKMDQAELTASSETIVNYFWPHEQPHFFLENDERGFTDGGLSADPSASETARHILTDRRLVSVVAQETQSATLSVPLSEIEAVTHGTETVEHSKLIGSTEEHHGYFEVTASGIDYRFYTPDIGDSTLQRQVETFLRDGPHDAVGPVHARNIDSITEYLRSDAYSPYAKDLVSTLESYLDDRDGNPSPLEFAFDATRYDIPYEYEEGVHRLRGLDDAEQAARRLASALGLPITDTGRKSISFGRRYVGPDHADIESIVVQLVLDTVYETRLSEVESVHGSGHRAW